MKSKKQQEIFTNKVAAFLNTVGAEKIKRYSLFLEYKINTDAGILFITLHEPCKEEISSIYTMFENEKKAVEILGNDERLNKYSGKWNFHSNDNDVLFFQFASNLLRIGVGELINY